MVFTLQWNGYRFRQCSNGTVRGNKSQSYRLAWNRLHDQINGIIRFVAAARSRSSGTDGETVGSERHALLCDRGSLGGHRPSHNGVDPVLRNALGVQSQLDDFAGTLGFLDNQRQVRRAGLRSPIIVSPYETCHSILHIGIRGSTLLCGTPIAENATKRYDLVGMELARPNVTRIGKFDRFSFCHRL